MMLRGERQRISRLKRRRGAVAVLALGFLLIAIAFLAFSTDIGYITVTKAELQNAADAAARAGARRLANGPSEARAGAVALAAANEAAGEFVTLNVAEDVEIGRWNRGTATFTLLTGADEAGGNAVRVTCRRSGARGNPLPLFFAPVLGTSHADVAATATARVDSSVCGPFIGIDKVTISGGSYTDSYNSDAGFYSAVAARHNGHVCSNGSITLSGPSYVDGNALPGPGHTVSTSGSSYVTGSRAPRTDPLSLAPVDFGDSATNNNNHNIPISDGGNAPLAGTSFNLSGGDHVTLDPGIYYFSKFTLSGGSGVTITGPTVIYCTGDFTASGGSVANLSQIPANLQIYCTGGKVDISGSSSLYGVVYAPSSKVVRSGGSSDIYGMFVGKELTLSGGGGAHGDEALGILKGARRRVVLAQ
ncbi:MAG TPA: pilus assembly protein TadG-related protein [Pirellulaceae bacterium]|nr:pilus assembly protein TadG-related protein [Pirellulaceae bacterium]